MYIPKLMLLIFNFILLVIGLIALSRGLSDYIPLKLKPLENALDVGYFPKIMLFGGCAILFIAFLGFWGAEMENRTALITYKILLGFVIGIEIILLFYFAFNEESIHEQISLQMNVWKDQYDRREHQIELENVQNYFKCCEINPPSKKDSKKPLPLACEMYPNSTCTPVAYQYFSGRTSVYLWFLKDIIAPEVASIMFADMVAKKILMLQNIMLGKLGSS